VDDDEHGGDDDILLRVEAGGRIHLDQSGLASDIKANYLALPHFEKPMLSKILLLLLLRMILP
jgi:hypothetical protein